MATFKDANNEEWTVFIDIPTVKRLREHDRDVLGLFDDGFKGFEKLVGDPVRLVDTISLICQEQIQDRKMDDVAFAKALYGDALARAVDALVEGVSDFFHDPKRRETIKAVFRKAKEVESAMYEQAAMEVESVSVPDIMKMLEQESTESSTKSPASLA